MALHVLKDCTAWIGSHDFTGETNEAGFGMDVAEKECTTFGSSGSREYKAGLRSGEFNLKGFWQAGTDTVDSYSFTNLGTSNQVATFTQTGVAGDVAYFGRFGSVGYEIGGQHGEMAPFALMSKGSDGQGIQRGKLAKAKGNVSGTGGMGSVVELTAVGASQYLYAAVHIFSAGTTITMDLASDDDVGFASGTTRATIGPLTTAGGTWMTRVAGPITDNFFLFNVTACTGTFSIAAAVAVGS